MPTYRVKQTADAEEVTVTLRDGSAVTIGQDPVEIEDEAAALALSRHPHVTDRPLSGNSQAAGATPNPEPTEETA